MTDLTSSNELTKKDFVSSSEVRWCPGCGDYAILSSLQNILPSLNIPREKFVFVSGIGCSSRFPYYMNTYGFHSIHGRAPAIASGIKVANPDLSVWVITGDGDGLSIGGNHILHTLRRNIDLNIVLFNNKIYGLTKGQYSPTSDCGQVTKTSPYGTLEQPINPICVALASEATFVARTVDSNPAHMKEIFKAAHAHKGVSFIEVLQKCVIFNDTAWANISEREVRDDRFLFLENDKPLIFGKESNKGIVFDGFNPVIQTVGENGVQEQDINIHNQNDTNPGYAYALSQMKFPEMPTPVGIFRSVEKPVYEVQMDKQIKDVTDKIGRKNIQSLLRGNTFWKVKNGGKTIENCGHTDHTIHEESSIMDERVREILKDKKGPITDILKIPVGKIYYEYGFKRTKIVKPKDSVAKAISVMKSNKVDRILVIDSGKLVGILTEREIALKTAKSLSGHSDTPVLEVMNENFDLITESTVIAKAVNIFSNSNQRYIPIELENGKFGIISIRQILWLMLEKLKKNGLDE